MVSEPSVLRPQSIDEMEQQIEDNKQATDDLKAQMADLMKRQADLSKSQSHIEAMLSKLVSSSSGQTSFASGLNASPSGCLTNSTTLNRMLAELKAMTANREATMSKFLSQTSIPPRPPFPPPDPPDFNKSNLKCDNDALPMHQAPFNPCYENLHEPSPLLPAIKTVEIPFSEPDFTRKADSDFGEETITSNASKSSQVPSQESLYHLPVFDGTLLDCWIVEVDRFFELQQYGNEEKLDLISMSVEGAALKWFRRHRREFTDWTDIKRKLMARFGLVKGCSLPEVLPKEKLITKVDQDTDFENLHEPSRLFDDELQGTLGDHTLAPMKPYQSYSQSWYELDTIESDISFKVLVAHECDMVGAVKIYEVATTFEKLAKTWKFKFKNNLENESSREVSPQILLSQFQVSLSSLEPGRRYHKESLVVVNDLSSNLRCVIGKTIGCICDSEIGQDNSLGEEEFNRVWEPGGVLIEHDKWKGSGKRYELSRMMSLMQGVSSTWWSYGKVAELTQELQQPKTYLKASHVRQFDVTTTADAVWIANRCESSLLQHSSATQSRAPFSPYQNYNDQPYYERKFGECPEIEFDRESDEIKDEKLQDKQPEEVVKTLVISENEQFLECVGDEHSDDEKPGEVLCVQDQWDWISEVHSGELQEWNDVVAGHLLFDMVEKSNYLDEVIEEVAKTFILALIDEPKDIKTACVFMEMSLNRERLIPLGAPPVFIDLLCAMNRIQVRLKMVLLLEFLWLTLFTSKMFKSSNVHQNKNQTDQKLSSYWKFLLRLLHPLHIDRCGNFCLLVIKPLFKGKEESVSPNVAVTSCSSYVKVLELIKDEDSRKRKLGKNWWFKYKLNTWLSETLHFWRKRKSEKLQRASKHMICELVQNSWDMSFFGESRTWLLCKMRMLHDLKDLRQFTRAGIKFHLKHKWRSKFGSSKLTRTWTRQKAWPRVLPRLHVRAFNLSFLRTRMFSTREYCDRISPKPYPNLFLS